MSDEHIVRSSEEDRIVAVETLHNTGDTDLHFRVIGTATGREFVLNIQLSDGQGGPGEYLRPVEYDFLVGKILALVLNRMTVMPNSRLH